METFKKIATQQLDLMWYIFMLGIVFLPGAIPANACGTEQLYQRVVLANYFLVRASLAAAVLLLAVQMAISIAESNAVAAARDKAIDADHEATVEGVVSNTSKWRRASLRGMLLLAVRMYVIRAAARAATAGHMAFDAHHEAAVEGLSSIKAKWKRALLRGMLLLALAFSAAASFLAIVIFEDWCQYCSGCDAGYGLGSPFSVYMMVATTLAHGCFAWVAVCKN